MNDFNQYDDNQLIALLKESSSSRNKAFNEIYNRYSERLHSYCMLKSDNREDSKELFQETWIRFYNSVNNSKQSISLPAYIYVIARNLSIDHYRTKKSKNVNNYDIMDFENFAASLNIHAELEQKELLSLITLAINSLPEIYKEAFLLRWFSGLSYKEIAEVVNETSECIRKRSSRAMEEVLKILKPVIVEIEN